MPLQVRFFTSDSYRDLKVREGKRERRQVSKSKISHEGQMQNERDGYVRLGEGSGMSHADLQPNESELPFDLDTSLSPLRDDSQA